MTAAQTSTPHPALVEPMVGRWSQPVMPLALALCLGAACLALSVAQADPTEATEGRLLTVLAAGVVACAAFAAQLGGGGWLPVPATGSVLVLASLWLLHQGPQRGGAVVLVLVVTLAAGLARSWPRVGAGAWGPSLAWATSLAIGVQLLVYPEFLLPARADPFGRLWFEGILLPALFGIGIGLLAGVLGRPALLAGVALLIAGPGLDVPRMAILTPALLLSLGAVWLWRRSGFDVRWPVSERLETRVARPLLVAGALVVVLASYPRLHPAPWTALPGLVVPPRTAAVPLERGVVVLRPDAPVWRRELAAPVTVSRLTFDSSLVHGLAATGETVATVLALGADGEVFGKWPLVGGIDTADWAAERRDVRALEGFRAPVAWSHYVPPGGGFFANRYRAHLALDGPHEIAALEVRLEAPASDVRRWELHLVRVELRR